MGIPQERSRAMALSLIKKWASGDTRDNTEPGLWGISSLLCATGEEFGKIYNTGDFCAGLFTND
ncbi:hypothetical protein DPMN_111756 [Dreissena polymorpha]|uniref:Uncharacterized protein n=1 Tax=Dreissena polymorpha TaxID=45954 RepID=A0A9D4QPC8_DREPO|nr:hypothetical protein DPMN_111756 [Dreissena polymorpha]